jgi:hypothetical protein
VGSIGGKVAWSALSDRRAKRDVRDLDPDLGLELVRRLRPVAYTLVDGNGRTDLGFVAQEVEAVLGDGFNLLGIGGDPDRTLFLRHADLLAPLVKAVQEQQAEIAARDDRIARLEASLARRDGLVEELARRVAALEGTTTGAAATSPPPVRGGE